MYVSNIFVLDKGGRCTRKQGKAIFLIKLRVVASQDMMRIRNGLQKYLLLLRRKRIICLFWQKIVFLAKCSLTESQSWSYDDQVVTDSNPGMFMNVVWYYQKAKLHAYFNLIE